ncbi:hypothetical protein M407DRAFT_32367 [Tulasnella calospora MUT 4182]|uniref:Uncharacterized protein n=1 Tax=Tulasnella calospora MUT 4182 TaxID=1051891 RepID=A0A0C3L922_9AGAM|nr:hypothetical protein M407DRAFT_32367 [Tulasnella calospora MUT 4182]
MPPTASGRPIFYGESSKEAEDFIFAIKERAYAEGKQRDNAWIAEFVSICFAKTALRWYEELDEDVQNDWRLLKHAILAEYQEESHPRDETSPQFELPTVQLAALSITPAASPSTNPPTVKGQILVESESASLQGYIGGKRTHNEWCIVTQNIDRAAVFELNIPDRTIRFQDDQSVLAVRAYQQDWKLCVGSTHFAGLYKGEESVPGWSDSIQSNLWSLGVNNMLIATWPNTNGGLWYLEAAAWTADKRIYLVPDCSAFTTEYSPSTHKKIPVLTPAQQSPCLSPRRISTIDPPTTPAIEPLAYGDIIFTGGSAEEAEDFIFAIKKRAYSKGKHQDNAWIRDFVSICFAKKALRWYVRLDPETRNDWELLQRAILDEYEETSIPSSLVPTSASVLQGPVLKTIPAAGPPLRTGRIRVDSAFDQVRGYIAKTFYDHNWCTVTADQNTASIFDLDVSAQTIKFQGNTDDYLTVRAYENNWDLQKGSPQLLQISESILSTAKSVFIPEENLDHRFATTSAIEPLAYGDIIFTGGSAEEAEDFIFAIKKRAYSKGKHKDNVWITDFVSICFAKKALRWYERLTPETRNDWELLKLAILDEYEEASIPSSLVPTSASTLQGPFLKPAPAAGPPIRTGRIRVDSAFDQVRGYIAKTFIDPHWCTVTGDQNAATIFEFDVSARTIKFQGNIDDYLTVRPLQKNWDLRKGSNHFAALTKNQGRTAAIWTGWSDDIQVDQWSVVDESKLAGRWSLKAGGFWELDGFALTSDKRIYLGPDYQAFSQTHGTSYKPLALYFETLP